MMQKPISWSRCGQVCFIDGKAWAVTPTLQRICLGEEAEIKQKLAEGKTALEIVAETVSEATKSTRESRKRRSGELLHLKRERRSK